MDIKDLNKSQLILLAVLLSFVTSIATGITTVTLMQQAPPAFTEPVNRIIQQTVEKIQQVEGKTTVQTVIVKEEDLVVDAIAKNASAVFTIEKMQEGAEVSAGFGFAISKNAVLVTDAVLVPEQGTYIVKNDNGKFHANFLFADKSGFSFVKVGAPVNGTDKLTFTVPDFGDINKMKIGQKILVLGRSVSSFIFDGNKNLDTNISKSNGGALVLDINGNALGVALSQEAATFASIESITSAWKLGAENPGTQTAAPVLAPGI